MVGLHWLFSSRSLTIACTVATVLSGGEIQGANAAVLDRRQGESMLLFFPLDTDEDKSFTLNISADRKVKQNQ